MLLGLFMDLFPEVYRAQSHWDLEESKPPQPWCSVAAKRISMNQCMVGVVYLVSPRMCGNPPSFNDYSTSLKESELHDFSQHCQMTDFRVKIHNSEVFSIPMISSCVLVTKILGQSQKLGKSWRAVRVGVGVQNWSQKWIQKSGRISKRFFKVKWNQHFREKCFLTCGKGGARQKDRANYSLID